MDDDDERQAVAPVLRAPMPIASPQPATGLTRGGVAFAGSPLSPEDQALINRADRLLVEANRPTIGGGSSILTGGAGQPIPTTLQTNPNSTASISSVLNRTTVRPDPTQIIDANFLNSLKTGDTVGSIAALAGNVQESQNFNAVNFLRLTQLTA